MDKKDIEEIAQNLFKQIGRAPEAAKAEKVSALQGNTSQAQAMLFNAIEEHQMRTALRDGAQYTSDLPALREGIRVRLLQLLEAGDAPKSSQNFSITKEWTEGRLWKKRYKVHAEHVELGPEYGGLAVGAKVTIFLNDRQVYTQDVPWPAPKADLMLPFQVYLLAKEPNSPTPKWQPVLEKFALRCEGFTPPTELYWGKGFID